MEEQKIKNQSEQTRDAFNQDIASKDPAKRNISRQNKKAEDAKGWNIKEWGTRDKIYAGLIAGFSIACVVLVGIWMGRGKSDAVSVAVTVAETEPAKPIVETKVVEVEKLVEVEREIKSEVIRDGLKDMGFLVTEKYFFTEVTSDRKVFKIKDFELGFTEASFVGSYDGIVTAGVDFTKAEVEKDDDKKLIRIRIPKAEIFGVDIDPDSFQKYSEKESVWNKLMVDDFNAALVDLEKNAKQKALERGILKEADQNAERMIRDFGNSFVVGTDYQVIVEQK